MFCDLTFGIDHKGFIILLAAYTGLTVFYLYQTFHIIGRMAVIV